MSVSRPLLRKTVRAARRVGEGLFSRVTDATLWMTIFTAELSIPQSKVGQVFRAQVAADRFLSQWNYSSIKQALAYARRKRLVRPVLRGRHAIPEITEAGKQRLSAIIPVYDEKRIWDARMHLVTYDIPEKEHLKRDALRDYLRAVGAGKLQESVWMTPYNPIDLLRTYVTERQLNGMVIVSDIGENGSVGEEDLRSLVVRVWKLDEINEVYKEWLTEAQCSDRIDHWLLTTYLSILRRDPQLPFTLLPKWWKGDEAYRCVALKLKELELLLRPRM